MRQIIAILLLLPAALLSRAQTMSLKECIDCGIANNLGLQNSRIDITKSRIGVSRNRARLLPVINGMFQITDYLKRPVNVTSGTVLGNDFPDDPTWQTIRSMQYAASTGVQLNVPLYNPTILASVDVAKTVERLSRISYDKAVEELTVQIGKVYYLAQSYQELDRLYGENIARMQDLCSISEAMYDQGIVLEIDYNRALVNLADLKTGQDRFSTLYVQQINLLRFLLDLSPDTPLDIDVMDDDVRLLMTSGVSGTLPELQLAQTQKELTDRKIKAVKAAYIPTISLTGYAGGLGYQEKFNHFFHTVSSSRNWFGNCFIGLNITIPIFDAGSKKLKIRQHRLEAEQADNNARALLRRLDRDYSDAMLELRHNLEAYHTQTQSCRQALDVYKVTEEQYREGISSMTSILQDEMQLRTAQAALVQAKCRFNIARLDLLRLSGKLSLLTE